RLGCVYLRTARRPALLPVHILPVDILAMYINNEPVRVGQQESVVPREVVHFQHNSRASRLKFGNANLLQEAIVYVEGLADQGGSEFRVAQVEENSVRMRDALGTEFHFLLDIYGDSRVIGRGPVANPSDPRQRAASVAGGICEFGGGGGVVVGAGVADITTDTRRPLLLACGLLR